MAKTRSKHLESLRNQGTCIFIGDKAKMIFHRKDCPCVEEISKDDLYCCGKNPTAKNFSPCQICMPKPITKSGKPIGEQKRNAKPLSRSNQVSSKSKSKTIQDAMRSLATRYEMHLEFVGPYVYVTTVAGEWYFDFNVRPIILHHKNEVKRFDRQGCLKGHYHIQEKEFSSPMLALAYIYRHEEAAISRAFRLDTNFSDSCEVDAQMSQRERILTALSATSGNKTAAAKILGVSTSTLLRWRKKHGIK